MMNRTVIANVSFKRFIILLSVILSAMLSCNDDEKSNENNGKQEKIFKKQEYVLPANVAYSNNLGNRLSDSFYFVGWSKEDIVAYITEPADEATGFYFFNFIIFDTKIEKTLYEWTIGINDEQYEGNLQQTWENNIELFSAELNKYKIYQGKANFNTFPLFKDNINYSFEANIEYAKHEYFNFDVVSKAEIFINNQNEKKLIFKKEYEGDLKLNVKATGCVLSPYSNMALLIVNEEQRGYEGPPHLIRIEIKAFELKTE